MKKIFSTLCILIFLQTKLFSQSTINLNWLSGYGEASNSDIINSSTVDNNGNVYVTGRFLGVVDFDPSPTASQTFTASNVNAFVGKYSPTGNLIWVRVFSGPGISTGLSVDYNLTTNEVLIAGTFGGGIIDFNPSVPNTNTFSPISISTDMFIVKYSMNGSYVNMIRIGSSDSNFNNVSIKNAPSGGFVVVGAVSSDTNNPVQFDPIGPGILLTNASSSDDGFIASYAANWVANWAQLIGSFNADGVFGVDIDASGNIYTCGNYQLSTDFNPAFTPTVSTAIGFYDMFIAKYNGSNGQLVWLNTMGDMDEETAWRVKLDGQNNLVVTAIMESASFDADPSPTGTLTLNKQGTGQLDMFIGKYAASTGSLVWAKNAGGVGTVLITDLTIDSQNNIYTCGFFNQNVNFDFLSSALTLTTITPSGYDMYVAKYKPDASLDFAQNFGGSTSNGCRANSIRLGNNNSIFLSGIYQGTTNVDPVSVNNLPVFGGIDMFLVNYTQCIAADIATLSTTNASVCANGSIVLSIANGNLNSATNWVWASTVCGTTPIGTGTSITVSPVINTNYFVRGEGGCVTPGACASVAVNVVPLTEIYGQVSTASVNPVSSGLVILYKVEQGYTMWDSATYQNIQAGGNFTFTAVNSGTYILLAQPTSNTLQNTYAPNAIGWKNAQTFFHGCQSNTVKNVDIIPITNLGGGPGIIKGKIFEGVGYGNRSTSVLAPGNPIGGLTIKAGRNPGGDVVAQGRTDASGEYTLSGLSADVPNETFFVYVDIPGLDTNGTYHMAIVTGSLVHQGKDFVVDSMFIHPHTYVGVQEMNIDNVQINVYPNPASNVLNFDFGNLSNQTAEITVVDMLGNIIESTLFNIDEQSNRKKQLNINAYNNGIYFVGVKINNFERKIKIIKAD